MRGVGYITDRKLGPSKAKPTVVGINLDKPSHVNGTAAKKTHVKINGQNKQSAINNTQHRDSTIPAEEPAATYTKEVKASIRQEIANE